jgi:hypothetical protein
MDAVLQGVGGEQATVQTNATLASFRARAL